MKASILFGLLSLSFSVANATPIKERTVHPHYFVAPSPPHPPPPLEWQVEVLRNKTITVRGTLEDVIAEAVKHNPNWERDCLRAAIDHDDDDDNNNDVKRDTTSQTRKSLNMKRKAQDFHATQIDCGRFESVEWMEALKRVQYLYGVGGKPTNGPGRGACTRVSCAYNTAVVWCNDDPYTKSLTSFANIADGAMAILGQCMSTPFGGSPTVSGQAFNKNNWNVIVRKESC